LALLLLNQEVPGPDLVLGTGYSDFFAVFTKLVNLKQIVMVLRHNSDRLLHYCLIILLSGSIYPELLLVKLNHQ
jgi:hypothetical protein